KDLDPSQAPDIEISKSIDGLQNVEYPYPNVNTQLPLEGDGYKNYSSQSNCENEKWGQPEVIEMIEDIAGEWNDKHPDKPIYINDLSRKGGGPIPPHTGSAHQQGTAFDIKFISDDGEYHSGNYDLESTQYNQSNTIELINMMLNYDDRNWFEKTFNTRPKSTKVSKIYFNDPEVRKIDRRKVQYKSGHSDHLHIEINMR
ncbi:MAG: penicillin-insensitive murein endopeptidase, partial [Spirochaetes bacterium]|nr:penicillin-insensitive murein endopeptidase [Spirochaetota bacterium]